ncbi:hypothetical protein ACFFX0_29450, partial [Citricoccus parietis]
MVWAMGTACPLMDTSSPAETPSCSAAVLLIRAPSSRESPVLSAPVAAPEDPGTRREPGSSPIRVTAVTALPESARAWPTPTGSAHSTWVSWRQPSSWSVVTEEAVKSVSTSSRAEAWAAPKATVTSVESMAASSHAETAEMFWWASPLVSAVRKTSNRLIRPTTVPIRVKRPAEKRTSLRDRNVGEDTGGAPWSGTVDGWPVWLISSLPSRTAAHIDHPATDGSTLRLIRGHPPPPGPGYPAPMGSERMTPPARRLVRPLPGPSEDTRIPALLGGMRVILHVTVAGLL